jgi:alpha,alpha-trehalase
MHPAGWLCLDIVAVQGLDAYGFGDVAERLCRRSLAVVLRQHELTGKLWEKYNVVDGGIELPNSRYGIVPFLSWTAAAVVLLGRRLFEGASEVDDL